MYATIAGFYPLTTTQLFSLAGDSKTVVAVATTIVIPDEGAATFFALVLQGVVASCLWRRVELLGTA
jgi:hypothetical protein